MLNTLVEGILMAEPSIQLQKVLCAGGLETTENHLLLSDNFPGAATRLINYEVSPSGGYKSILGYSKFDPTHYNVDDAGAEGELFGLAIYIKDDGTVEYIAARKQQSGAVYNFYISTGGAWTKVTDASLGTSGQRTWNSSIAKIRHEQFNFGDGNIICFTDGVNKAALYNGTDWSVIDSAATGADHANAGGNQAIDAPAFCTVFENHLFLAGSYTTDAEKPLVVHSAPNAYFDFLAANGAGQIFTTTNRGVGFAVNGVKPFRDKLYVFAEKGIKFVSVSGTDFVINDVTSQLGCIASDSIVELGGDLMFLSSDGFRKIGGTPKIGDVDLSPVSVPIRPLINSIANNYAIKDMHSVIIRDKLQVRYFYGGSSNSYGIIGGLRFSPMGDVVREWGSLYNITPSICTSEVVNGSEQVIFGDYNGNIFFMESGNSFDGEDIYCLYSSPFLDQGDPGIRKTYRVLSWFLRSEEPITTFTGLRYDWNDPSMINPNNYTSTAGGVSAIFDDIGVSYGGSGVVYDSSVKPIVDLNIQGSGRSIRVSLVTVGQTKPHTIQGFTLEFTPHGRV
jgi:hypothetical protein